MSTFKDSEAENTFPQLEASSVLFPQELFTFSMPILMAHFLHSVSWAKRNMWAPTEKNTGPEINKMLSGPGVQTWQKGVYLRNTDLLKAFIIALVGFVRIWDTHDKSPHDVYPKK